MAPRLRILIVEDYDSMRALVQRYVQRACPAEVVAVPSPLEALALARRQRFDLVISDFDMPGMNGLEFLAALRADPRMKSTRFIMLTCSDDRDLLREAMALGADEYHTKPVTRQTLEKSLTRVAGAVGGDFKVVSRSSVPVRSGNIRSLQFGRAGQMPAAA